MYVIDLYIPFGSLICIAKYFRSISTGIILYVESGLFSHV
jgi:hypothetical protein